MIKHSKTPVTEVILHTSATPGAWARGKTADQMRDEIDRWHRNQGWAGIGYHRVIAPDGTVALGRSIYTPGAHVSGHNTGTIGVCLIPSRDVSGARIGQFADYYTEAQRQAVRDYIAELAELTPIAKVSGHNDYTSAKTCPGFKVRSADWMPAAKPAQPVTQADAPTPASPPSPPPALPRWLAWLSKLFGGK